MITIKIMNRENECIATCSNKELCYFVLEREYEMGDRILIDTEEKEEFYDILLDDTLGMETVYLKEGSMEYVIPFHSDRTCYSPRAFQGKKHLISVKKHYISEKDNYRNLARNVYDQKGMLGCFPHASATVETRGEAAFEARNAIDGFLANDNHGEWPYSSWGINRDKDAKWKLEFGRHVILSSIVIYERADFPHDNWWNQVTIRFSDNTTIICELVKTAEGQVIHMDEKETEYIILESLIQSEEPSPFPALTQVEVYGRLR